MLSVGKRREINSESETRNAMNCKVILLGAAALPGLLSPTTALAQSPGELRGKSVTASWTEEREQRSGAQTQFSLKATPQSLIVYISTEGRLFTRRTAYG